LLLPHPEPRPRTRGALSDLVLDWKTMIVVTGLASGVGLIAPFRTPLPC
jgi:hypothetical protein